MKPQSLACSLLVVLGFVVSGGGASTSSTLLKRAGSQTARSVRASRHVLLQRQAARRFAARATTQPRHAFASFLSAKPMAAPLASATSTITSRPFLKRTMAGTGFRSFSQRATRLQTRLQKSFSLRAIFSDVLTNHPGKVSATARAEGEDLLARSSSSCAATELQMAGSEVSRPFFQDLQRITTGTIQESWSGFVGGYALGMTTDIGRRVLKFGKSPTVAAAASTTGHVLPYPSLLRQSQTSLQVHGRSMRFGTEWAQMSAVFGASRLLVQTLRRKEDEWNTVTGSALAGSVFACYGGGKLQLPPIAMARGALLYGGTMFLLHPHLWKQGTEAAMLTTETSGETAHAWLDGLE